jgi:hypothetical protein
MRRLLIVGILAVAACKKPAPPGPAIVAIDAAAPVDAASVSASVAAVTSAAPPLAIPVASDKLEPIALPKHPGSKLIWLKRIGDRMWLSGTNLDAFSDGDGPMAKGTDPFAKLDYKPGTHSLQVVGSYPHLFVLRTKRAAYRWESAEPAIFAYAADTGVWTQAKPLPFTIYPHAFMAYRDGALLVTSGIQYNARPGYIGPEDRTKVTFVGPDGAVSDAKISIPPMFQAFGGASDAEHGALLGVVGTKATKDSDDPTGYDFFGAHVVHFDKDGNAKSTQLTKANWSTLSLYRVAIKEHGGRAIVNPGGGMKEEIGWPNNTNVYVVDESGKAIAHEMAKGDCQVYDADAVGDAIYAVTRCFSDEGGNVLLRRTGAKVEKIAFPAVAGGECHPESLVVRDPDDLWVTATCKNGPTIFRRGRPQEPLTLP